MDSKVEVLHTVICGYLSGLVECSGDAPDTACAKHAPCLLLNFRETRSDATGVPRVREIKKTLLNLADSEPHTEAQILNIRFASQKLDEYLQAIQECDTGIENHRKEARSCARAGLAGFAHAFNACENDAIPYRYSREALKRFEVLARELVELVETGAIEINPAHAAYRLAHHAKQDPGVQKLLKSAMKKAGISKQRNRV